MSRPRGLPHSIRHTGIECTFLPEVYMYTTLARTQTHGHETASLRSVMSGAAVTRTTENKSAMAFEHSGMPSFAPGDSVLESQGADGLRTAKLSQNSDIGSGTPTKCRAQVLPAELSDSNMLSSVPGDSALESQGAGGLRTAKLSQFYFFLGGDPGAVAERPALVQSGRTRISNCQQSTASPSGDELRR